jgi:hypothetical protein
MSDGKEEWLTTAQDFNHVTVYERRGGDVPVYIVRFQNWEIPKGFLVGLYWVLAFLVLLAAGILGGAWMAEIGHEIGIGWIIPLVIWIVIIVLAFKKLSVPWNYQRAIEIDQAGDALRIYRDNKLLEQHQLSRLANLTVEPHPEAEAARENRILNNGKRLRWEERQHCLFGWFGIGGAQKICLVCKVEWPNKNSLAEAQAAIMWARDKAREDKNKLEAGAAGRPSAGRKTGRKGMRPPLE